MSLPPPSPVAPPLRSPMAATPRPARPRPVVPAGVARRVLVLALLAGGAANLAVRHGWGTVAGAVAVAVAPLLLVVGAGGRDRRAWACLAVPVALAPWLALRDSHWLVPLDLAVAGVALLGAAGWSRGGAMADGGAELMVRLGHVVGRAAGAPAWAWAHVVGARPASVDRVDRRVVVAGLRVAPVVAVMALLLASGDALLASWLRVPGDPASLVAHVAVVLAGAVGFFGLHRAAADRLDVTARPPVAATRRLERTLLVAGAVAVEAAFVAAQAVAALAGDDYVQRRTGLTYADHARRGFFQLLAVAALALGIVLAARRVLADAEGRERRVLRTLALVLVGLTLALVGVALQRLRLYEDAYGLTMLRLYSTVFAAWLGVVLVLAGAACVRPHSRRWLVPAVAGTALVGLVGMNVANPEALVVRHNVAHAERTGRFDPAYLVALSDDAVPALVHAARTAQPVVAGPLRDALCSPAGRRGEDGRGLAYNRADRRSHDAVVALCAG